MNCNHEVISSSSLGNVVTCTCGIITINVGNASLKIPKESFTKFSAMIDVAYANLVSNELSRYNN